MSSITDAPARSGKVSRLMILSKDVLFGTLAGLTALGSILSLGWLMRHMRMVSFRAAGLPVERPGWVLGSMGSGFFSRLLGGLSANIREGIMGAFSLAIASFPFGIIWLLSWWAGWENSFSKGYEQAFVGPILGLTGVAIFCFTMIWLPMALAHQAVENRAFSFFEWRMVRSAVRHTGWGSLALAFTTVFFALPIFASRGLIVFASNIVPGFDTISPEEAEALAGQILVAKSLYAFVALVILRGWAARLYANAVARALVGPDAGLWEDSPLSNGVKGGRRAWKLTHWMRGAILPIIWFGLAAQIYVAQFLNHDWHLWLTHPMWLLPWPG